MAIGQLVGDQVGVCAGQMQLGADAGHVAAG